MWNAVWLQPWIMSKQRFLQQDTLHTPMHEGPAWGAVEEGSVLLWAQGWYWVRHLWVCSESFVLNGISSGRAEKELASAMWYRELSVGPWRNQFWLKDVQGQQGLLHFEPGHQLSRDQYRASPCLAGKGGFTLCPQVTTGLFVALSKSWEEELSTLSETPSSDSSCWRGSLVYLSCRKRHGATDWLL